MDLSNGWSTLVVVFHTCLYLVSSELCLPAKISSVFSLLNPTPVFPSGPVVYTILSYSHSQSDWCQLSLKWQCCGVRNSGLWSLVWVPWTLFSQYSLPNFDTIIFSRSLSWLLHSFSQWTGSRDRLMFYQGSWLLALASPMLLYCVMITQEIKKAHFRNSHLFLIRKS